MLSRVDFKKLDFMASDFYLPFGREASLGRRLKFYFRERWQSAIISDCGFFKEILEKNND